MRKGVPARSLPAFSQGIERTASTSGGAPSRELCTRACPRGSTWWPFTPRSTPPGALPASCPPRRRATSPWTARGRSTATNSSSRRWRSRACCATCAPGPGEESGKDFRLPPLEALLGAPARSGGRGRSRTSRSPGSCSCASRPSSGRATWPRSPAERAGNGHGPPAPRIEELREGRCIQALHVGPFAGVPGTRGQAAAGRRRSGPGGPRAAPPGVALRPGADARREATDRRSTSREGPLTGLSGPTSPPRPPSPSPRRAASR